MRQHSKVVHASSGNEHLRAAKVQERMASSISVDWSAKRAPQNPMVYPLNVMTDFIEEASSTPWCKETFQGVTEKQHSCSRPADRSFTSALQGIFSIHGSSPSSKEKHIR
jgi:hypothetical protein